MTEHNRKAFTLVEMMIVIAMIGVLIALLLPGVQAAREAARRAQCVNNLSQIGIALQNYESAFLVLPPGSVDRVGPIRNVVFPAAPDPDAPDAYGMNGGYDSEKDMPDDDSDATESDVPEPTEFQMSWIAQLLPQLDQPNAYKHIDFSVGAYNSRNCPVRREGFWILQCPSAPCGNTVNGAGVSTYAGCHHDQESPIDVDNHGVLFLNSHVSRRDVSDGTSHTIYVGEKPLGKTDNGWMSGTRSTLRNTGGRPNSRKVVAAGTWQSRMDEPFLEVNDGDGEGAASAAEAALRVGSFSSFHPGGANHLFGDGQVRFIFDEIDLAVYQQLGHRADGKLLSRDY